MEHGGGGGGGGMHMSIVSQCTNSTCYWLVWLLIFLFSFNGGGGMSYLWYCSTLTCWSYNSRWEAQSSVHQLSCY